MKVLCRPRLILEQGLGWGSILALGWWWLGLQESSWFWSAVSLLTVVVVLGGIAALAIRARRMLASESAFSPVTLVVAAALLVVCGWAAWRLVSWVPDGGLGAQAVSFAARFGTAYLLVLVAWLNVLRATSAGRPRAIHESTVARP